MGLGQKAGWAEFASFALRSRSTGARPTGRPGLMRLWTVTASSCWDWLNSVSAASSGTRLSRGPPESSCHCHIYSSCHSNPFCRRCHQHRHRRCYCSHPWQQIHCSVSAGVACARTPFGSVEGPCASLAIGHMLCLGPIVSIRNHRITPLAILVVALRGSCVHSGPGIISLSVGVAAVGILCGNRPAIRSRGGVVPGSRPCRTIGPVHRAPDPVETGVWVINGGDSIGVRIRIVDGVWTIVDVWRVVITCPINNR